MLTLGQRRRLGLRPGGATDTRRRRWHDEDSSSSAAPPTLAPPQANPRFPLLDGLRAVAACAVLANPITDEVNANILHRVPGLDSAGRPHRQDNGFISGYPHGHANPSELRQALGGWSPSGPEIVGVDRASGPDGVLQVATPGAFVRPTALAAFARSGCALDHIVEARKFSTVQCTFRTSGLTPA
jgi:hypothetical protein